MSGEVTFLLVSVGILAFGLLLTVLRKMIDEKVGFKANTSDTSAIECRYQVGYDKWMWNEIVRRDEYNTLLPRTAFMSCVLSFLCTLLPAYNPFRMLCRRMRGRFI